MTKTFEDRILDAIVAQFFAPDQNGLSPIRDMAGLMFRDHSAKIVEAVVKNLDVEKLADEMAKSVVRSLEADTYRYGYGASNTDRTELKKRVREKVATALNEWQDEPVSHPAARRDRRGSLSRPACGNQSQANQARRPLAAGLRRPQGSDRVSDRHRSWKQGAQITAIT